MSQPIEDEDIALNVLAKLRQWKPLAVTVTRDVAVTDFGRLILLDGAGININLPVGPLTRSGSLRVTTLNTPNNNRVECGAVANAVRNLMDKSTGITDILFHTNGGLFGQASFVDLYYEHTTNQWYFTAHKQDAVYASISDAEKSAAYDGSGILSAASFKVISATHEVLFDYSSPSAYINITELGGPITLVVDFGAPSSFDSSCSLSTTVLEQGANKDNEFVTCKNVGYVDDAAAAGGGVPVGGIYRNSTTDTYKTRMA
jgi:hypothetical protein